MELEFTFHAHIEYMQWEEDPKIHKRINDLIQDALQHPFTGLGKPEPLRGNLKGYWSRRITREHRLVYKVSGTPPGDVLTVVQCRFHY
jgi:toxin YoeB